MQRQSWCILRWKSVFLRKSTHIRNMNYGSEIRPTSPAHIQKLLLDQLRRNDLQHQKAGAYVEGWLTPSAISQPYTSDWFTNLRRPMYSCLSRIHTNSPTQNRGPATSACLRRNPVRSAFTCRQWRVETQRRAGTTVIPGHANGSAF